jgi:hypothetical protein
METLVREKNLQEVKAKVDSIVSDFGKVSYLESALTQSFTFDVKRFLYTKLAEVCEQKKMYEKAGRALLNRTTIEVTYRERISTFIKSAEMFVKAGKLEMANQTFLKAYAEGNSQEKTMIKQKMVDTIKACADEAEKTGRKQVVIPYYIKLLEMPIGEQERQQIKQKLISAYKTLGKFAEVKSLEMGLKGQHQKEIKEVRNRENTTLDERTNPHNKRDENDLGIEIM